MNEEKKIQAHVSETGGSIYAVSIEVSGHKILGDEPIDVGGKNLGPSPFDLLLAALGECTAMTVRWYAQQQNWPLEKVEVKLSHAKLAPSLVPERVINVRFVDVFEKHVILHGDQLTEEQKKKLVEVAEKCPVQRTLQSDVVIRTR